MRGLIIRPRAGESPPRGRLVKCLLSSNFLRFLTAGAWPLCVKGAVTTVVVTGGLSPSAGRRLVSYFRYNPSVFLLRKNPPPFAQGRLAPAAGLCGNLWASNTSSTAVRRSPFPSRGRLARTLLYIKQEESPPRGRLEKSHLFYKYLSAQNPRSLRKESGGDQYLSILRGITQIAHFTRAYAPSCTAPARSFP